jgi:hypothetical protein
MLLQDMLAVDTRDPDSCMVVYQNSSSEAGVSIFGFTIKPHLLHPCCTCAYPDTFRQLSCNLTGSVPASLAANTKMVALNLASNNLEGDLDAFANAINPPASFNPQIGPGAKPKRKLQQQQQPGAAAASHPCMHAHPLVAKKLFGSYEEYTAPNPAGWQLDRENIAALATHNIDAARRRLQQVVQDTPAPGGATTTTVPAAAVARPAAAAADPAAATTLPTTAADLPEETTPIAETPAVTPAAAAAEEPVAAADPLAEEPAAPAEPAATADAVEPTGPAPDEAPITPTARPTVTPNVPGEQSDVPLDQQVPGQEQEVPAADELPIDPAATPDAPQEPAAEMPDSAAQQAPDQVC